MRASPLCETLEQRRYLALTVHQELHRPPRALAHFNNDGLTDVVEATVRTDADGKATFGFDVYLGDGKGGFHLAGHTDCDDGDGEAIAAEIAVGDVDRDGAPDIVMKLFSVTGQPSPVGEALVGEVKLVFFSRNDRGEYQQRKTHTMPHVFEIKGGTTKNAFVLPHVLEKSGLAVADLDGDGAADVVSWVGDDLAMFASGPRQSTSLDGSWARGGVFVATGDLDGDGRAELLAAVEESLLYATYEIDPAGGTAAAKVSKIDAFTIKQGVQVAVGDLDGDGYADDLVVAEGSKVSVGLNNLPGSGTATPTFKWTQVSGPFKFNTQTGTLHVGDIDGDGIDDLFAIQKSKHDAAMAAIQNTR